MKSRRWYEWVLIVFCGSAALYTAFSALVAIMVEVVYIATGERPHVGILGL